MRIDKSLVIVAVAGLGLFFVMKNKKGELSTSPSGVVMQAVLASATKQPGSSVNLTIQWQPTTKDFRGNPVLSWPYRFEATLNEGNIVHADYTPLSINAGGAGPQPAASLSGGVVPWYNEFSDPFTLQAKVKLLAATSDANGAPTGTFTQVASMSSNYLTISPDVGAATPFATIGGVTISRRRYR